MPFQSCICSEAPSAEANKIAVVGSNEIESGCKCRLKKLCVCGCWDVIEVGLQGGWLRVMDNNDVEPSPLVEIVVVVCGVTSREQGFWEPCAVEFWDVSGCGMISGWLKGDGSGCWVASAMAKGAVAGWGLLWDKSHVFGLMCGYGRDWFKGCREWGWSPAWGENFGTGKAPPLTTDVAMIGWSRLGHSRQMVVKILLIW